MHGTMIRSLVGGTLALLFVVEAASAQQAATIAGTARDTTGGVLPGVTVEAASPALIEKVRTAVTDSDGQYQIVDLRPGTYTVTFTLTGFSTVKREGIVLTAGFTATVNARPARRQPRGNHHGDWGLRLWSIRRTCVSRSNVTEETLEALPTGTTGVLQSGRVHARADDDGRVERRRVRRNVQLLQRYHFDLSREDRRHHAVRRDEHQQPGPAWRHGVHHQPGDAAGVGRRNRRRAGREQCRDEHRDERGAQERVGIRSEAQGNVLLEQRNARRQPHRPRSRARRSHDGESD